jgi:hypothetical protein
LEREHGELALTLGAQAEEHAQLGLTRTSVAVVGEFGVARVVTAAAVCEGAKVNTLGHIHLNGESSHLGVDAIVTGDTVNALGDELGAAELLHGFIGVRRIAAANGVVAAADTGRSCGGKATCGHARAGVRMC